MPAFQYYQEGNSIGAGGNKTFTFPQRMGTVTIINAGPSEISFVINGAVPANTNRGVGKTRLDANQSLTLGDGAIDTMACLAGAGGAGVEVVATPNSSGGSFI